MGKKSSKDKSTTVSGPPSWAVPIIKDAANLGISTIKGNQGTLQGLQSDLMGQLPQIQNMAMDTSTLSPGQGYIGNVLGGQYLNSNPYVEAMAHQGEQDAGNAVNSTFSLAGRTGGNNHATDLARGVAQAGNSVRFQNYQNERGLQGQAASLLPGYQQARTSGVLPYLASINAAANLPYAGIQNLSPIGGLFNGYGTSTSTTSKSGGGLLGGLLGGILGL